MSQKHQYKTDQVSYHTNVADHGERYRPPFGELVPEHKYFYIKHHEGQQNDDTPYLLTDFAFFNIWQDMVPLPELDGPFELRSHDIFGAGMASIEGHEPVYIHIRPLRHYDINLADADGSMHIESERAIYSLGVPSKQQDGLSKNISTAPHHPAHHGIIQLIVAFAKKQPEWEYEDFLKECLKMKIIGDTPDEGDIWDCVPRLRHVVENLEGNLCTMNIVQFLLYTPRPQMILRTAKPSGLQCVCQKARAKKELEVIDLTVSD
ncbi:uncharacterized protein F5147DRAFT_649846 [Suillus discolor]|uniref:Uncharacterized protein n=1 Tax=Suillus discolor TaxID=1912936 RepID=A0A9P7FD19_9AGAM|nr:uncharacterized protein F5147DRAFT_649846 [Suillus discolor]KAG2114683.1 hypothetical protein F5147DRAFT_649846 [Suillus discolor]